MNLSSKKIIFTIIKMSKFLLYLRHGNDEYSKLEKLQEHRHDYHLNRNVKHKLEMYNTILLLLSNYGVPDVIRYSPMARTRETKRAIKKIIKKHYPTTPLPQFIVDTSLTRYFNHKERQDVSLCESTAIYEPPINEEIEDFNLRVAKHIEYMLKHHTSSKVWCITHAMVYKRIAKYHFVTIPLSIPFLHHIVV